MNTFICLPSFNTSFNATNRSVNISYYDVEENKAADQDEHHPQFVNITT
jgi:hypothetical protein